MEYVESRRLLSIAIGWFLGTTTGTIIIIGTMVILDKMMYPHDR